MSLHVTANLEPERHSPGQALPAAYLDLSEPGIARRLERARAALGSRVTILGHHYQRDEVIRFADFSGDSLYLSRMAAGRTEAEFVVFCGVHFMAESADILRSPHQRVILPNLAAGCSMADMVTLEDVESCWQGLEQAGVSGVVPIAYINSSAAIKAFCGERGGAVCTSANAVAVLEWAWKRGERVLLVPDQHLGRNTAWKLGVQLDQMAVWDPDAARGGVNPGRLREARIILWDGHCCVHTHFSAMHVQTVRAGHPGIRVIVHPECTWEVVQAADESASTDGIIGAIGASSPGSVWAVGTEIHLVRRLARIHRPDRTVIPLDPFGCLCATMFRISPNHLLWTLEELVRGQVPNRIQVPDEQKAWARVALDRMLQIR